jgi:hypothetical protein
VFDLSSDEEMPQVQIEAPTNFEQLFLDMNSWPKTLEIQERSLFDDIPLTDSIFKIWDFFNSFHTLLDLKSFDVQSLYAAIDC